MRAIRFLIPLAFLLLAAGCPKGVPGEGTTPPPTTTKKEKPTPTPDNGVEPSGGALIITANEVFYASRGDDGWTMESVMQLGEVAVAAAADDTALWIITTSQIVGFDNAFGRISTVRRFQPDTVMTADVTPSMAPHLRKAALYVSGGDAYVSEGGQFFHCEPGNMMNRSLQLPKTAHDVFVHEDEAFLVDDIMRPLWLHRVDLSGKKLTISASEEVNLINGHLGVQWVDLEEGQWHVTTISTHRVASEVGLRTMPLGKGEASSRTLWAQKHSGEKLGEEFWPAKTYMMRVTKTKPFWGLAKSADGMVVYELGKDADPAAIADSWKVPGMSAETPATGLAKGDGVLFVAVDRTLYVLNISGDDAELEARITIPALPVDVVSW